MNKDSSNMDSTNINAILRMNRRTFVKMAGAATGAFAFGGGLRSAFGQLPPLTSCGIQEVFPASPFIVNPFIDPLPQPQAYRPGWQSDPTLPTPPGDQVPWTVRRSAFLRVQGLSEPGVVLPGPGEHQQDIYGRVPVGGTSINGKGETVTAPVDHDGTHQVWPTPAGQNFNRLKNWPAAGVEPIYYHIRMQLGTHSFTSSRVRPIDSKGSPMTPPPGVVLDANGTATLPLNTIYGFNGTFPGPMINVEYGKPVCVRFENDLDKNPQNLDRQDFGAPDWAFLTHLHNGHSAPESDGQPHYMQINDGGYVPGDWFDCLYLNYPAGGDPSEIQSFLWFHDHRMHHTGANVYKGMVGLMPHYDSGMPDPNNPGQILPGTGLDPGDETKGLHLPGVRVDHPDGTFDVKYDIPMALYDVALDDGVTPHADMHTPDADCGKTHPEWWGKTFFKHYPNHGFVGDIFTVNCVAFPVLHVYKRRYRFRFLGASIARIYELALMTSANGPVEKPGTQGQWQIPDGMPWKQWTWIASMGGLLPKALDTDTFHLWPANRREFVVDFTNAKEGDVIYITNLLVMVDGRKPDFNDPTKPISDLKYKVPLVKIVVGGLPPEPDQSAVIVRGTPLRPMPKLANGDPVTLATTSALPHKEFILSHSGGLGEESSWLINNKPFEPLVPLTTVVMDNPEVWISTNGGGGWVHPMHMHMEEHTVIARKGSTLPDHPEDTGKEDVNDLEPSESVTFYRNFRTFSGRYVAHCHNLAHEDHNMMFGFTILPTGIPSAGMDIKGKVTDLAGAPLAGVTMQLTGAMSEVTETRADGTYGFTRLVTGDYTITPSLRGYKFQPVSKTVTYILGFDVENVDFVGV